MKKLGTCKIGLLLAVLALLSGLCLLPGQGLLANSSEFQQPEPRQPISDEQRKLDETVEKKFEKWKAQLQEVGILSGQSRILAVNAVDQIYDNWCGPATTKEILDYRGDYHSLSTLASWLGTDSTGTRIDNVISLLNAHQWRQYIRYNTDYYPTSPSWQYQWFLKVYNDIWNYVSPNLVQVRLDAFYPYYIPNGAHYLAIKGFYYDTSGQSDTTVTWVDSYNKVINGVNPFGTHTMEYRAFAYNVWVSAVGSP